jgi:hypothetical protein
VCCNPTQNPGGTPKETSIAIIGVNKIAESDLTAFASQYGMAVSLSQVELNGPSCCNSEMTLDIESATAFSNSFGSFENTAHIYAYEGGGTHISDHLDAWEEAHSRDQARVASTSFGAFEDHYGGLDPSISDFTDVINAMAAEGWTIIAASGDHGATDSCEGRSVSFPASDPYVLAAGGTTLALTNNAGAPQFGSEVRLERHRLRRHRVARPEHGRRRRRRLRDHRARGLLAGHRAEPPVRQQARPAGHRAERGNASRPPPRTTAQTAAIPSPIATHDRGAHEEPETCAPHRPTLRRPRDRPRPRSESRLSRRIGF